jgi:hypothetical protein
MSTQSKPSIVFCHGLWADGSCFSKVIAPLQTEGHQVIAAQYGLDTPEGRRHRHPNAEPRRQSRHPRRPLLRRIGDHRRRHR